MQLTNRSILKPGDRLYLCSCENTEAKDIYEISGIMGEGASSVCYEAKRGSVPGRLKEFNPLSAWMDGASPVRLKRLKSGRLQCEEGMDAFQHAAEEYLRPYRLLGTIRGGRKEGQETETNVRTLNNYMPVYEILKNVSDEEADSGTIYIWSPGDREGLEFRTYLQQIRSGDKSPREDLKVILETAAALTDCIGILHRTGLLHLDLKPANFLMAMDSSGKPISKHISLYDFNTLYAIDSACPPEYVGTEGYSAPELRHGKADSRTDIYSIGALLYTGLLPADDKVYRDDVYADISCRVRESLLINGLEGIMKAQIEDSLSVILRKCLAYDRSRRYRSCEELKKDLERTASLLGQNNDGLYESLLDRSNPAAAIQRLLSDHPLYAQLQQETDPLSVAVVGDDTWSRLFLDAALVAAQNLRNHLKITVYAPDADNAAFRYRSTRPALSDFVKADGRYTGGSYAPYAELEFRNLPDQKALSKALSKKHVSYAFVTAGRDELSVKIAQELYTDSRTVVCALQGREVSLSSGIVPAYMLEAVRMRGTDLKMAFNAYLAWRGQAAKDLKEERRHFREKYQYQASVANAVSISYKLQMLHYAGYLGKARSRRAQAEQLELLLRDEEFAPVLDELAMREHRRWVMEKVCAGWHGPGKALSAIYYQDITRTGEIRQDSARIHPCIAHNRNRDVLRLLTKEEWDNPAYIPAGADEFDLVSLRIHRALCLRADEEGDAFASNHGLYCDNKEFDYDLIRKIPDILRGDRIANKDAAVYHPSPIDTGDVVLPEELQKLTELLAANIHDVWALNRLKEGWRYGEKKSQARKTTPDLVPYEKLPEEEKNYDRNTAMETLKVIVKLGYQINGKFDQRHLPDGSSMRKA